jgi:hypothetical protein
MGMSRSWQAALWVCDELQEKIPVPACIAQLSGRRSTQGKSAKNEGPRMECELLRSLLPLLADKQDGFDLPHPPLGYTDRRQYGAGDSADGSRSGCGRHTRLLTPFIPAVRKMCQKCIRLKGKGLCFERKQITPNGSKSMGDKEMNRRCGNVSLCCHA